MILKTSKTIPDRLDPAPPAIGSNGNWWAYDSATGKYTDTGVKAKAKDGAPGKDGINTAEGLMVYKDPTFTRGVNGARHYNNAGGTTTVWERIPKPADCPSLSTHVMRYTYKGGGVTSPGYGGFTFLNMSRADAVFVYRIVAKIPEGYWMQHAENAVGNNPVHTWHTSNKGTGRYEEYIYSLRAGKDGTFSTAGYFYFYGGADAPFEVIVSYATCYDMTNAPDYYSEIAKANQKANELRDALDNANSLIDGLSTIRDEIIKGTLEPRKFQDIQYLLDALQKDGSFKTGILLSSVIALSGKDGNISSYLSGARGDGIAMLRAGVEHFGGAGGVPETAQTTIWSDGSVDIGDMHFVNEKDPKADHIDFTDKAENHTYLQIGGTPKTESEMLKEGSEPVERELEPVSQKTAGTHLIANVRNLEGNSTVTLTGTITAFARATAKRIDLPPEVTGAGEGTQYLGSRASVSAHIEVKVYSGSTLKNTYTSQTLTAQAEVERFTMGPRGPIDPSKMRSEVSKELPVTLAVPIATSSESMVVSLVVTSTGNDDYSTAHAGVKRGIKISSFSSNRKSLVSIMRDKVAFFFSRQKYLLFNYLSDYLVKVVGNVLVQGTLKADNIHTDSINGGLPIKVLAHGTWEKWGTSVKYTSVGNAPISISRIDEGLYYLRYPTSWDYTHLSFLGTANSLTDTGTINTGNIGFSKAERGRVRVFTGDDSSGNDSDVYFQIILRDFSN